MLDTYVVDSYCKKGLIVNREQYYKNEEELKKMKKPMYVDSLLQQSRKILLC